MDLQVGGAAAVPAPVPDGPTPVRALVLNTAGEMTGELLLWISSGFISALEYAWVTDEPPVHLPDPSRVTVTAGSGS